MKTTIATFFAAHKTTIMIASAALVIGAKAMSFTMQNNQYEMDGEQQQMMMQQQQGGGQMQQGYNQQMPQQNGNGEQGYFDSWFGGNENGGAQGVNYDGGYNNNNNQGSYASQSGGYSGYTPTTNNNYGTGAYSASNYNTNGSLESTSAWQAGQNGQDGSHERFVDAMREETKYNDGDGNSYKLSSGYEHNYVNTTTNEYVQTNDASVTPGAYSNYTAVTPSDYSSSSSSSTPE